jgi:hypothetical protein
MKKIILSLLLLAGFARYNHAQDLLSEIEDENELQRVSASFKNSRVINAQSLETTPAGVLDFKIQHRFGNIKGGFYDMFGLDQANMRMSFDYGITNRLQIGVGRSTYEKTYDGLIKYRILWQTESSEKMPLSLLWYSSMSINTLRYTGLPYERTFDTRLNYTHQLIIGRKFSRALSLELIPGVVHRNFVYTRAEKNTVYTLGAAGRVKLSNRIALTCDYFYVLPNQLAAQYKNPLSVGVDIETGGHVFQLHLSSSPFMVDKAFITETTADFFKGDLFFGFNLSRVFTLQKPKN